MTQTAGQIVAWAEQYKDRSKGGASTHLTEATRQDVRLAYLTEKPTPTRIALGERFGINRETVATMLHGPEFDRLESELLDAKKRTVKQRMVEEADEILSCWKDQAREGGNHKAAKEWLEVASVIDPVGNADRSVQVIITGLSLYGTPAGDSQRQVIDVPSLPPSEPEVTS